jgi:hypothetical protein
MITKQQVLSALIEKVEANRAECRRLVEEICSLPGHAIHSVYSDSKGISVDLLQKLSEVWKQGRALAEVAEQLVPLVYDDGPSTFSAGGGKPDLRAV